MQKFATCVIALAGVAQANYLSGEVRSQEWFTYGKFVAKMQNPGKMGTVQSFFTYTAQDWPHGWNEIDVEVVPSVTDNPFSMNIIWRDGAQDHDYATGFHPGTDWFTYSVEWTPDYVSWYVNDKLVRKTEGTEDVHFLDMPTQLMMNFWTPCWSPWNDYFDDAEMPWYAKYDYVEVYDYDVNSKEFSLRWKDDFNTWDAKKWYASDNWGFENNSSLFMSSQVYVEDGSLVLKMDYNDGHAREFPAHHEVTHHEKPLHEDPHHVEAHHDAKAAHVVDDHKATVAHHQAVVEHEAAHVAAAHQDVHAAAAHQAAAHEAEHVAAAAHEAAHREAAHVAAAHHEAAHEVVAHHVEVPHHVEAPHHADHHQYDAPVVHHSQYSEYETGYPTHYSEHESYGHGQVYSEHEAYPQHHETTYGYPEHESSYHGYPEHESATTHHFKHGYSEGDHGAHTYETVKYETGYPTHHEAVPQHEYHVYTAPVADHREGHETVHHETVAHYDSHNLHDTYPHHDSYPEHYTEERFYH